MCRRAVLVIAIVVAGGIRQARADEPVAAASDGSPALLVDGEPVTVVCGREPGVDTVLVVGALGDPLATTRAVVDTIAEHGDNVVAVALPADATAAAARLDATLARVAEEAGSATTAYCRTSGGTALGPVRSMVMLGTAAGLALRTCEGPYVVLVDPVVSDADVERLAACAARNYLADAVVSSCPAAQADAARLARAYRGLGLGALYVEQIPGCSDVPLDDERLRRAIAVAARGFRPEGTDLVLSPPTHAVRRNTSFAVAGLLGFTVRGHGLVAIRPQVIAMRHGRGTFGVGGHLYYGSVPGRGVGLSGHGGIDPAMVGGGVDVVIPLERGGGGESGVVLEPSIGAYLGPDGAILGAGATLGLRSDQPILGVTELPVGVRVDAWYDVGTHATDLSLALTVDGVGALAIVAVAVAWLAPAAAGGMLSASR